MFFKCIYIKHNNSINRKIESSLKKQHVMKTKNYLFSQLKRYSLVILLLIAIIPTGCNKDADNVEPAPAPELPPSSSFVMDFSDFSDDDTTKYKNSYAYTYQNWWWGATNVVGWNFILTVTLVVPVAAFYESFNHQGIWDPSISKWVWSYNFVAGGSIHLAELHASLENNGVKWEMYITKNNAYNDFLWFYGITNSVNSTAEWHLYKNPNNPIEFLDIDWSEDNVTGEAEIQYTHVEPGVPGNGSYIQYGVNNSTPYDTYYRIYKAANDNLTDIEWNRTTKNGRVMDELHFGDPDWRCWDELLQDIICP